MENSHLVQTAHILAMRLAHFKTRFLSAPYGVPAAQQQVVFSA